MGTVEVPRGPWWQSDVASDHTLGALAEERTTLLSRAPPGPAELAEENARLRAVLGHCPKAIAVLDTAGRLVGCNRRMSGLFQGAPPLGRPFVDQLQAGEERDALASVIRSSSDDESTSAFVTLAVDDKRVHYLDFLAAPLRAADGESIGVVLAGDDRTGEVSAETENEPLRRSIEGANHLDAAQLASASLSHDVSNLLTSLSLSFEALRAPELQSAPLSRPDVAALLQDMAHTTGLAVEILQRAKRRQRRATSTEEGVSADVGVCVTRVLRTRRRSRWARYTTDLAPGLVARIAPTDLCQIFANLIANAAHAVEDASREGNVTVTARAEGGTVGIVVADDGIGIPAHALQTIFEPFTTGRAERGGSGLGLAIVRALVSDAGGTIDVVSTEGAGTSFRVKLPSSA